MLTDDRPSHPMTFTIRLHFSGRLDGEALKRAVGVAVRRHPLLAAHQQGDEPRHAWWVAATDPMPYLDIADESTPFAFPGSEQIDLRRTTGLRIWARTGTDRVEMRLQFHHSCCDGVGAYDFIEDLLCAYELALHPDSQEAVWRPIDPELLRKRTRFGLSWWRNLLRVPIDFWGILVGNIQFFLTPAVRLASLDTPTVDDAARLRLLDYPSHTFDEADTKRLREQARREGATFNDFLLVVLAGGVKAWNVRRGVRQGMRVIRIMIPFNLRGPEDERLPAANVVAMLFMDRHAFWFRKRSWLLASTKLETRFFKLFRFPLSFIRSVQVMALIPGGMKLLAGTSKCYATSVLSNLGRMYPNARLPRRDGKLRAGELVLERIESAPPVRPNTSTSLSTLYYADKLTIVMNYDRFEFTADGAQQVLATIIEQLSGDTPRGCGG